MKKNGVSALVVVAIVLLSPVWRGGRDTPLLGFSPTQLRPLWNHCRGRTALFLSPNWFSCSGCCASEFVAARPSPSQRPVPASGRFGDLSSFSAPSAPLLSLPAARGRSAGLGAGRALPDADSDGSRSCRRLWQPSEARARQQRATRAAPASNCSPSSFPYPREPSSTKKFHQLKCCAPEHICPMRPIRGRSGFADVAAGRKGHLHAGLFSFSSSPGWWASNWSFWRRRLACGTGGDFLVCGRKGTGPDVQFEAVSPLPLPEMLGALPTPGSSIHISIPCA